MSTYEVDGRNPGDPDVEGEHDFDNLPANPEPAEDEKDVFDVEDEHEFDDLPGTGGQQSDVENDQDAPANE